MNRAERQELTHAESFFKRLGFKFVEVQVPLVQSAKNGLVLCMDDRNKLHKILPGGAIPGAFTGLRIVMPGETPDQRAKEAIERCKAEDLVPTTHGDLSKGPLLGCAVRFGLIYGGLEGFPLTTAIESQGLISQYDIHHRILRGPHTAKKIILNFNERTTIDPNGEYFVIDFWVPLVLRARMDKFVNLMTQSSRIVLPKNNTLYIAT